MVNDNSRNPFHWKDEKEQDYKMLWHFTLKWCVINKADLSIPMKAVNRDRGKASLYFHLMACHEDLTRKGGGGKANFSTPEDTGF